jgi:hypothetical protein
VAVDKNTALATELLVLGFITPPFTLGIVFAVDVDIVVVALKVLSQPCSFGNVGAHAPSSVVSPGNVGSPVIEESYSTRLILG